MPTSRPRHNLGTRHDDPTQTEAAHQAPHTGAATVRLHCRRLSATRQGGCIGSRHGPGDNDAAGAHTRAAGPQGPAGGAKPLATLAGPLASTDAVAGRRGSFPCLLSVARFAFLRSILGWRYQARTAHHRARCRKFDDPCGGGDGRARNHGCPSRGCDIRSRAVAVCHGKADEADGMLNDCLCGTEPNDSIAERRRLASSLISRTSLSWFKGTRDWSATACARLLR
jgi:hypothetical protein